MSKVTGAYWFDTIGIVQVVQEHRPLSRRAVDGQAQGGAMPGGFGDEVHRVEPVDPAGAQECRGGAGDGIVRAAEQELAVEA